MKDPTLFGFYSNIDKDTQAGVLELLIQEYSKNKSGQPVLINGNPQLSFFPRSDRKKGEDPLGRYGAWIGEEWTPYLTASEAGTLFEDARRRKRDGNIEGRAFILPLREEASTDFLGVMDGLIFLVKDDATSLPFIYKICRALGQRSLSLPVKILVMGDSYIEKSAEFFLGIQKEFKALSLDSSRLAFAGFIGWDQEEMELAQWNWLFLSQMNSSGPTMGQIKAASKKAFTHDLSEISGDWTQRLQILPTLLMELAHGR